MNTYLRTLAGRPITEPWCHSDLYVADQDSGHTIGRITRHPDGQITARVLTQPDVDVDGPLYREGTSQRMPGLLGLGRFDRAGDSDQCAGVDRAYRAVVRHQNPATVGVAA